MKRLQIAILAGILLPFSLFAQEKKPTVMILPSDNWCFQRFYTTSFEDRGQTIKVSDYQRAFQEDSELGPAISQIGQLLTDLGYSLKDSEQELKALAVHQTEDENTYSKSGSAITESPLDLLKKRSKADIIIQLGWQVNKERKGHSVTFILEAFDSYTSKRIATATGTGKASADIVPRLLAEAVSNHIKQFDTQMFSYFKDLQVKGREIILTVKKFDSWDKDLETEFGGDELIECIQVWLHQNAVGGNFNLTDVTESMAQFEQVRIPFYNDKGMGLDARGFATMLRKYLQKEPFYITSKVMTRGLGEAIIVLGEK